MPQTTEIDPAERRHILSSLSKGLRNIGTHKSAVDIGHATIRIRARVRNRNMMMELATGVLRVLEADGKARFLKDGRVEILNKGYLLKLSRDFRTLGDMVRRAGFSMAEEGAAEAPPASSPEPEPEPAAEPSPPEAEPEAEEEAPRESAPVPSVPKETIPDWILHKYKNHIDAFETVVLRLADQADPKSRKDLFEETGFEDATQSRSFLQALEAANMVRIIGERRGTRYVGIRPAIDEALDMGVMLRHVVTPGDRKMWDRTRPGPDEEPETDAEEPETDEEEIEPGPARREEAEPLEQEDRPAAEEKDELECMREAMEAQSDAMIRIIGREKELRARIDQLEAKLGELLTAIRKENER